MKTIVEIKDDEYIPKDKYDDALALWRMESADKQRYLAVLVAVLEGKFTVEELIKIKREAQKDVL